MKLVLPLRSSIKFSGLIENPIFNFFWFYSVWLSCVIGKNQYIYIPVLLIVFHYFFVSNKKREFLLGGLVALLGLFVDGLLSLSGFFNFSNNVLIPAWLVVLWFGFASTLTRGLRFLRRYPLISVIAGGFGGSSSYLSGGYYFEAVEFGYSMGVNIIVLFIHWAILLPLLLLLAEKVSSAGQSKDSNR